MSFLLAGDIGNATITDLSCDKEIEIFGLRMNELHHSNMSGYSNEEAKRNRQKTPLVSTPSNIRTSKFEGVSSKDAFMFAPVNTNSDEAETTRIVGGKQTILKWQPLKFA